MIDVPAVLSDLTVSFVRSILDYDSETGAFTWRDRPDYSNRWRKRYPGTSAGAVDGQRVIIRIGKRAYRAHRIAWLHFYGEWPKDLIDHRDGNAKNNAINLRIATESQNRRNQAARSTRLKGVTLHECGLFKAQINIKGRHEYLGYFTDEMSAHKAYADAARRLFGEFACWDR